MKRSSARRFQGDGGGGLNRSSTTVMSLLSSPPSLSSARSSVSSSWWLTSSRGCSSSAWRWVMVVVGSHPRRRQRDDARCLALLSSSFCFPSHPKLRLPLHTVLQRCHRQSSQLPRGARFSISMLLCCAHQGLSARTTFDTISFAKRRTLFGHSRRVLSLA